MYEGAVVACWMGSVRGCGGANRQILNEIEWMTASVRFGLRTGRLVMNEPREGRCRIPAASVIIYDLPVSEMTSSPGGK